MTRIVCRALTCVFWEKGACSAEEIEYEPDVGCLTFQDIGDFQAGDEEELDWGDEGSEPIYDEDEENWETDEAWEDGEDL